MSSFVVPTGIFLLKAIWGGSGEAGLRGKLTSHTSYPRFKLRLEMTALEVSSAHITSNLLLSDITERATRAGIGTSSVRLPGTEISGVVSKGVSRSRCQVVC